MLFESLHAAGVEECPHLGDGDAVEHGEALGLWQPLPDKDRIEAFEVGEDETVEPRPISKPLEFEGFEIRVEHGFPDPEELDSVPVAEPVGDEKLPVLRFEHVGEGDEIAILTGENRYGRSANSDGAGFGFAHGMAGDENGIRLWVGGVAFSRKWRRGWCGSRALEVSQLPLG